MSAPILRALLTLLLYAGVAVVFFPLLTGQTQNAALFVIGGALTAVVCGLARCCLMEGGCSERTFHRPTP